MTDKGIRIQNILAKIEVEWRHWSDVFTSSAGIYNGSEYLYRLKNESEIRKELGEELNLTDREITSILVEYEKTISRN